MNRNKNGLGLVLLVLALVLALTPVVRAQEEVPVVPTGGANSVRALLYARPFSMDTPYLNAWTREQQTYKNGYILVLEVDPALVIPKQTWMPVLYVGTRPAETTNIGQESGRVVVLVPGDTDLYSASAYFGSVQLPERVDAERGAAELVQAQRIGVRPFSREMVDQALRAGGQTLRVRSIDGVYRAVGDVISAYSPQEEELVERYRQLPTE